MFSLIWAWVNGWVNNREAGNWDAIMPIMTSQQCVWNKWLATSNLRFHEKVTILQNISYMRQMNNNSFLYRSYTYICMIYTKSPFQYHRRRLIVRSRKVSKPQDVYLELYDRYEIWQAPRQQCCRRSCQISKRCNDLNYQSCGFEILLYLTIRRLIRYWNGAQYVWCLYTYVWTSHERMVAQLLYYAYKYLN